MGSVNRTSAGKVISKICQQQAFVVKGYDCWKNAVQRFGKHESSAFHRSAIEGLLNIEKPSICEKISQSKQKDKQKSRIVLEKIFSSVVLLARRGLALRGDGNNEDSNFLQILKTRAEDVPVLKDWLENKKVLKWLHHDIVNEILQTISYEVLQKILTKVKRAKFYAVIADGKLP